MWPVFSTVKCSNNGLLVACLGLAEGCVCVWGGGYADLKPVVGFRTVSVTVLLCTFAGAGVRATRKPPGYATGYHNLAGGVKISWQMRQLGYSWLTLQAPAALCFLSCRRLQCAVSAVSPAPTLQGDWFIGSVAPGLGLHCGWAATPRAVS